MTAQLTSIGLALLIFPLIIWVPGMVLAYSTNLLEFRARPVPTQIAVGLLISISCLPIVSYLIARAGGFRSAWVFYGIVWSVAAILLLRHGKQLSRAVRDLFANRRGTVVLIAICMIAGGLFEMDWVSSNGVRPNLCNMDATAHVATTDALTRTGVPPVNPFVYPGYPVHLMYYYAWYIMCSLVDQLGGTAVTARSAVQAGKIYIGLGVVALIVAFLEIAGARLLPAVKRIRTGVAVALLTITGLDLIPWVFLRIVHRLTGKGPGLLLSIEWWNEQVTAWLGAILMSPHHPAGLIEIYNMRSNFWGPVGPQTIATRDAYVWIDQHTPRDTVVLFNPDEDIEYFFTAIDKPPWTVEFMHLTSAESPKTRPGCWMTRANCLRKMKASMMCAR